MFAPSGNIKAALSVLLFTLSFAVIIPMDVSGMTHTCGQTPHAPGCTSISPGGGGGEDTKENEKKPDNENNDVPGSGSGSGSNSSSEENLREKAEMEAETQKNAAEGIGAYIDNQTNEMNNGAEQGSNNSSASIKSDSNKLAGDKDGDPVLISSGKYVLESDDIEIPGTAFNVSRKYLSEENTVGSMGAGWLVSMDSRLIRGVTRLDETKLSEMDKKITEIFSIHESISINYSRTREIKNYVYNKIYLPAKADLEELRVKQERGNTLKQLNQYSNFSQSPEYYEGTGNENLVLIDEGGSPYVFKPSGKGVWLPEKYPEREYMRLESLDGKGAESTAGFTLSGRGGRKKYYNGYGLLIKSEELNGNVAEITRNTQGRITRIKGPFGNEWQVTYSGSYISKISGPENTEVIYGYSGNRPVSVQDTDGDTVKYTYTGGRLQQIQKPDGSAIKLVYGASNSNGALLVTATTNEEGFSESFSYNAAQSRTTYTNHSGVQTVYYYDSNYRTTKEEHSDGSVITYSYNEKSQLSAETLNGFRISYSYNSRGNMSQKAYSDNTRENWEWNNKDQLVKYTDRDGVITIWTYDSRGNCTEIRRGAELIFTGSYNTGNRLVTSREGERAEIHYTYNNKNLPVSRSIIINGQMLTEMYEYDGLCRILKYTDTLGRKSEYSYSKKETAERTPEGLIRRFVYNNRKDLTLIEEKDNITGEVREQRIEYDRRHLPLQVTDGAGVVTKFQYRADGKMTRQQTGAWYYNYGYEAGGRVSNITRGLTGGDAVYTETYGYQRQSWNEERTVNVKGAGINMYQINVYNQVTGIKNALGELSARTVNGSGNPVREQGASGGYYSYRYDASGRVIEAGREGKDSVSVKYNRDGNIAEKTDRLGNVTRYVYDGRGLLSREITSLGENRFFYDEAGRKIRQETVSRNSALYYTDWIYSADNRTITVTAGGVYRETLYLNAWGEVICVSDGEGSERRYEYNGAGKLIKSFDGYNRATQYAWNEIGRIAFITYADGSIERYEYDHLGNVTMIKDAAGISWSGEYDEAGRLFKETGRPGIDKEYKYDAMGRITEIKSGMDTVERYRYTNRGREVVFTDGAGKDFTQQKNEYGELINEINRAGDAQSFSYDAEGRLTAASAYSGKRTITEMNEADGKTITVYSDGTKSIIERDLTGNIIRAENETGIILYKYDAGGKLIEQNDSGAGEVTRYTYDRAGRRVRMQSGNRDVHYRYGKNNELLRVYDNSQRLEADYEYDTRGREVKRQYGNGVRQETIYDVIGRVIMIRELNSRNQLLRAEGYLYDEKGRRSHNADEEGRITKYIYDSQSRLSVVLYPWTSEKAEADKKEASDAGLFFTTDKGAGERYTLSSAELSALRDILNKAAPARGNAINGSQLVWRESYSYDRNGNRSNKTTPWGTIRYEYDAENRLVRKGDIVYNNDKDGNVLNEKGIRYEANYQYNGRNRMSYSEVISHTEKTNSSASYRYDALGRRTITENVSGQMLRTVYDSRSFEIIREGETFRDGSLTTQNISGGIAANGNRLQSNQPTGERYRWISDGINSRTVNEDGYTVQEGRYNMRGVTLYGKGEAVAASYSSGTGFKSMYLGKDILGSVRSATADSGALEDRYEYDAFGQPYTGDLSSTMNLGYTGKPYDTVTCLYNYGYRDYKPQMARFTTLDPIRDGNNWFAYVNNDPVNWVDLWGLSAKDIMTSIVNNLNQKYVSGVNDCDIWVEKVIKDAGVALPSTWLDAARTTVHQKMKNMVFELQNEPAPGVNIVFHNYNHAMIGILNNEGTFVVAHNSSNPGYSEIDKPNNNVTSFEADWGGKNKKIYYVPLEPVQSRPNQTTATSNPNVASNKILNHFPNRELR